MCRVIAQTKIMLHPVPPLAAPARALWLGCPDTGSGELMQVFSRWAELVQVCSRLAPEKRGKSFFNFAAAYKEGPRSLDTQKARSSARPTSSTFFVIVASSPSTFSDCGVCGTTPEDCLLLRSRLAHAAEYDRPARRAPRRSRSDDAGERPHAAVSKRIRSLALCCSRVACHTAAAAAAASLDRPRSSRRQPVPDNSRHGTD